MSPNLSPALKPSREDPCTQARVAAQALSLHTHSDWNYPVYLYYYTLVQLHEVLCQGGRGPGRVEGGAGAAEGCPRGFSLVRPDARPSVPAGLVDPSPTVIGG